LGPNTLEERRAIDSDLPTVRVPDAHTHGARNRRRVTWFTYFHAKLLEDLSRSRRSELIEALRVIR